jgi:hypothetical protein
MRGELVIVSFSRAVEDRVDSLECAGRAKRRRRFGLLARQEWFD